MFTRYFFCLGLFLLVIYPLSAKEVAKFTSDTWQGFTNLNGEGLYWDIIRRVYEPYNIDVSFETTNYTRSVALLKNNKVHVYVGSYLNEKDFAKYPNYPIDTDFVAACTSIESKENISKASILKETVIWIKDYGYQTIFGHKIQYKEIPDRETGLKMVASGRAMYFIDAYSDIKIFLRNHPSLEKKIRCKVIHKENKGKETDKQNNCGHDRHRKKPDRKKRT